MHVILVPGLWLDASSWEAVLPALESAGHAPHPLTMPGVGEPAETSAAIGIADWVEAVVAVIDDLGEAVVLVGHSGGGNVVWGAADRRPDLVARVVFVDTMPPPPGAWISGFDVVDGVVPFPGWHSFDEEDVDDLDERTRAHWAQRARSVPGRVPTDPITLADPKRFEIPVTVLSGRLDAEATRAVLQEWPSFAEEFGAIRRSEVVILGSGHWPQFSQPQAFAAALAHAIR